MASRQVGLLGEQAKSESMAAKYAYEALNRLE
jgi:hypothetical protein